MSDRNCGYCYNRGCSRCDSALRAEANAASQRSEIADRSAWRQYAVAFLSQGLAIHAAFARADELVAAEDKHFGGGA